MTGIEKPIPHRCLAFTPEGPWCPNMAVIGRSFCALCLLERSLTHSDYVCTYACQCGECPTREAK